MKHFKLIGPKTIRDFDIEDDEMVVSKIIKIVDFEHGCNNPIEYQEKNVEIFNTESDN